MRVTEIAQIEVQDVRSPSGALRSEISLRAAITKGCRQRCVYLSHARTIEALERYLDYRIARRLRMSAERELYRGLEPTSKLVLTHKAYKFHLYTKRRVSFAGQAIDCLACDSLQAHVTTFIATPGLRVALHIAADARWHRVSSPKGTPSRSFSNCWVMRN
jgi:hypothetical protein